MGMEFIPSMGLCGELGPLFAPPVRGMHFGEHFMIDAYCGSREKLLDRELIQQCLSELPKRLGMQILAEPTVHWAEPNGLKDPGGWSGVVVIVESHISIHTFPGRRFAGIDVYTCRNALPTEEVETYFREVFEFEEFETNFVVRGKKYPVADY
jgi:S-adenosylmethionine decarboxylase